MTARYGGDDPIAAIATAPGESALAIVRCAGKGCVEAAAGVFSRPRALLAAAPNSVVHGWIVDNDNDKAAVDEVLIAVYRGPHSYTGEDAVEINCHGGRAAADILAVLRKAGFRGALAGEFSFRAFMNGKLDLSRAESVMEMVGAKTARAREGAAARLSGVLEKEINDIKTQLVEALAAMELFLDYSEDESGETAADEKSGALPEKAAAALDTAAERLEALAASWRRERLYQDGALAVIAGKPNAGKSSLFNVLLKEERSIVTEAPGTTRDWVEGAVAVEGIPLRLADTAGLRENAADNAERLGMERSRDLIGRADIILYVVDGTAGADDAGGGAERFPPETPVLFLWNKADIAPLASAVLPDAADFIEISAKTGMGVDKLCTAIAAALLAGALCGEKEAADIPALGSARQKELADAALAAVRETRELSLRGEPLDIIAPCLREALDALGGITGVVSTAEVLEAMFSQFCVGK